MLAPTGIGFLYGRRQILEGMPPFLGGGDMIREVYLDHSLWNEIPFKFEAGTPNIADAIAFGVAIDYLSNLGMENCFEHEQQLTSYALLRLGEIKNLSVFGPTDMNTKTGVVSFTIKGIHPHDVAQIMDQDGIALRSGFHCAMPLHIKLEVPSTTRASFYIYNTKDEIDKLIEGIIKVKNIFG